MSEPARTSTAAVATRLGPLAGGDGWLRPPAVLWHSLFVDSTTWDWLRGPLAAERRPVLIAAEMMAGQGVAGLSIGELARRRGIRPPSLYVYFPSKHALYDALFARGAQAILAAMQARMAGHPAASAGTAEEILLDQAEAVVRWPLRHAPYSQLLFWRPVPGFTPSPQAYEPAIRLADLAEEFFT